MLKVLASISEFEEEEVKVLTRLKETVDKQRDELRAIKRELQQKTVDCEGSMYINLSCFLIIPAFVTN